jgi:aspartate/methionine/tyrosine aminotransferase
MDFEPIAHMEWAKLAKPARINLGRSGVPGLGKKDLDLSFDGIEINGEHPYGYPPLNEAIAARHGAKPDNVIPSIGTSMAIFHVCAVLLGPGDTAAVERPAYEQMRAVPKALGARVVRFDRILEDGYRLDPAALGERIPDGTELVLMTNLHNPSGVWLSPDEIRAVAAAAERKGAWLFIDEVYLEFMPGDAARTAFGLAGNIITAASLTKVFGLSGLRCGWILVPDPLIPRFRRAFDHFYVEPVFPSEQISAWLFPRLDAIKEKRRAEWEARRRETAAFIAAEPRLAWVEPDGGIVGFPRVLGRPGSGDALARALLERWETSIVPGKFFEDPRCVRLGFGVEPAMLEAGLKAIRAALDAVVGPTTPQQSFSPGNSEKLGRRRNRP